MEAFLRDLRLAARALVRRPWFTLAGVLSPALGLGAASAVFALVDAVLLQALPYDDPSRIVVVWNRSVQEGVEQLPLSGAELLDLGQQGQSFERIGGFIPSVYGLTGVAGEADPERLVG